MYQELPKLHRIFPLIAFAIVSLSTVHAADRIPVRWPDWAKRTYLGIQDARDQQSHELKVLARDAGRLKNKDFEDGQPSALKWLVEDLEDYAPSNRSAAPSEDEGKKNDLYDRFAAWKSAGALYELDTEVDMLASALLALERPDVAIELYQRWYDEAAVAACLVPLQPTGDDVSVSSSDELWDEFYTRKEPPTFKHFRTPAAILFFSRAYRDRAIKTLETPGLHTDRLAAFEAANKDMAVAFYWLERSRKEISAMDFKTQTKEGKIAATLLKKRIQWKSTGLPTEESFTYWLRHGLPRPHSLYSWAAKRRSTESPVQGQLFKGDPNGKGTERDRVEEQLSKDRMNIPVSRPFPAFQALDFAVKFFEWEARIKRELGDMVYRVTGGTGKPKGATRGKDTESSSDSPTAAAYYIEARDVLYLARMVAPKNRQLFEDARAIDARIDWMQNNLPYGGQDFYQFRPYSPANYWTTWKTRLHAQTSSMESDWRELRAQREKAAAWVNQIQEGDRSTDMLKQQFNFQMNFAIREKMADIRFDLVNLETDRAQSALQNLQDESQTFLAESSLQLDSLVYEQELARVKDQIVDDALTRIGEVRRGGSLHSFRASFFPSGNGRAGGSSGLVEKVGYQRLYFTSEERREDLAFVRGMVANDRRLRASFGKIEYGNSTLPPIIEGQLLTLSDYAPGIIDEKEALWRVAALELQMAQARLRNFDNVLEVARLSDEETIYEKEAEDIQSEIQGLAEEFAANQAAEKGNTKKKIQKSILDRAKKEVERAKDHVKRSEGNIQKFRNHIARTQQTIKKIKDWGKRAEQAYEMFKTITVSFSTTPATIAGPMGGPIVDPAGAFEKKGRAALDRVKAVYQNLVQSQSFDELLQKLDREAATMQSNLATLRSDADNRVSDLETVVLESDLKYVLAVPETEIFQGIRARVEAIKQENVAKLQDDLKKFREDFQKEVAGTWAEERGNQVASEAARKSKARLEELDKRIQGKVDQSFEHIRVRFVAAIRAIEDWRQKEVEESGDPGAGRVFEEYMKQKAEAEYRLAQSEIRKAAVVENKAGLQTELDQAERTELHTLVQAAQEREKAARASMVSAIVDQETAWLRLVHTAVRWNRANDQAAELSSQIENIKLTTDRLKGERTAATSNLQVAEDKQSDAMKEQVARIEQLAAELRQMNSPEGRIVTADMLDRLAPALIAMNGTSEAQQRMRDGLDVASNILVEYARWLYLLSGDSDCRLYATRCESFGELLLSQQGLDRIANETLAKAGLARAGAFRISIPVKGAQSKFVRLTSRENVGPAAKYLHLCRGTFGMELREEGAAGFENNALLEFPTFDVGSSRVGVGEVGQPMLLCGFLPIINAKTSSSVRGVTAILRPAAAAGSGLKPAFQVPFKYGFQVNSAAGRQRSTKVFAAETLGEFVASERRTASMGKSLLEIPTLLPNFEYFGRSVYGGYRLELSGIKAEYQNVESVDVYVFYVTPATDHQPTDRERQESSPRRIRIADLQLGETNAATPKAADTKRLASPSRLGRDDFEAAWNDDTKATKLSEQLSSFTGELKNQNQLMQNYVLGTGVDPNPADLNRPISLSKSLQTCNVLLYLLSDDVNQRAEQPLESAATIVKNRITPNRVALSAINTIVADHNTRFQNLQKHVAKLETIDRLLSGTKVNMESQTLASVEQLLTHDKIPHQLLLSDLVRQLGSSISDDPELLSTLINIVLRRIENNDDIDFKD